MRKDDLSAYSIETEYRFGDPPQKHSLHCRVGKLEDALENMQTLVATIMDTMPDANKSVS